jgi:hypothetical protein
VPLDGKTGRHTSTVAWYSLKPDNLEASHLIHNTRSERTPYYLRGPKLMAQLNQKRSPANHGRRVKLTPASSAVWAAAFARRCSPIAAPAGIVGLFALRRAEAHEMLSHHLSASWPLADSRHQLDNRTLLRVSAEVHPSRLTTPSLNNSASSGNY